MRIASLAILLAITLPACTTMSPRTPELPALLPEATLQISRLGVTQGAGRMNARPHPWFAFCDRCPEPTPKTPVGESHEDDVPGDVSPAGEALAAHTAAEVSPSTTDGQPLFIAHFTYNEAALSPEDEERLRALLPALWRKQITLIGYTDDIGGTRYNDVLAARRAAAVRGFLMGLGLAPERIEAVGRGLCCYLASNHSPAGRRANRRVEVRVHDDEEPILAPIDSPS